MSSTPAEEIELLERVLLRLGCADSDDKLEAIVGRFLTPVILKITSPHDAVRTKVVEVLTHIKRRVTSRPLVQIPVEALLDQYSNSGNSPFLLNFAIIFITMGFPRLNIEQQSALVPKVLASEEKLENYRDKLFMLVLPILGDIKLPDDPARVNEVLKLNDKPAIRKNFLQLVQDVLLLPYGVTQDQDVPPGMSPYSFKRAVTCNWKAEELEKIKKGIVRLICAGLFKDVESFILLVLASSDTRFSVATPAIAELSKVCTAIDFADPQVTAPLYTLFCGNNIQDAERKTTPCCARVRQKLLQYLIKCRGKGINTPKGIQVIFEGLFGENTNQKCKVLALQFAENLIKDGPIVIVSKVAKVLLTGLIKVGGRETTEPFDVQNAALSALAQLSRTCPDVVNQDLKVVLAFFNHLANSPAEIQSSIRDALVAMAPAFTWKSQSATDEEGNLEENVQLSGQQHLLLAMLSDNVESKQQIVQNATSVFLTTCYPEYYAPARLLLLLIAGERNHLHDTVTTYLYGVSKKDHVDYNLIYSVEYVEKPKDNFNQLSAERRPIVLPSFKSIMQHVSQMAERRLNKNYGCVTIGNIKLAFSLTVYEEILDYLRLCLWYSAGARSAPGDERAATKLKAYISENYEQSDQNELHQYVQFVKRCVEAKRTEVNLLCLYDLLNVAPDLLTESHMHLLTPLANSLKDVSETMRIHVAQVYGILLAYGCKNDDFDAQISECLKDLPQKSLENKHGWMLVLGHAFSRKLALKSKTAAGKQLNEWEVFVNTVKIIVKMMHESQWLLVAAAVKCISMIGKMAIIPNVEVEILIPVSSDKNDDDDDIEYETAKASTKLLIYHDIYTLLRNVSVRARVREDAARCLGYLAIGDGEFFTQRNLDKFLSIVKTQKDVALNIAISEAMVATLNGYDVNTSDDIATEHTNNPYCNDEMFEKFMMSLVRLVPEPNVHSRQATSVWLLALIKNCSHRPAVLKNKEILQFAFTELLSDDSEFVQDVASRGLGLVYSLSDPNSQNDLANSLLDQLIGGKRQVNKVSEDTELFAEGMLGKTPTGGNITTYKELCSLASDLNQPEMVYQFMQLANHNAAWTSKLGAAFGLKSISADSKAKMQPYLGKIIPRLYRYKYDPTPKIQNSMISIWDSVVSDPKEAVEKYYWEILKEILDNLTFTEWRVRIACCLAVRDLLKRPNGLRLRSDEKKLDAIRQNKNTNEADKSGVTAMDVDEIPEPELRELWAQLFRVMDDIHEGTRLAAQGSVMFLSKLCVSAASSDHGKSGLAVASSILPLLLQTGVTHTVADIRKVSIRTISEMIDSSGSLIEPHLPLLIPCLLKATGEVESSKLSYLSTRLGADNEAQEAVDTVRAEAAKSHHTMESISKCMRYIDYKVLEEMTPSVLELIKTNIILGTKIACAHFVCLISIRVGKEMSPLVGKYLAACFVGLKDHNATVRKYYANAVGHLVGIAKEKSIKNLFVKLDELYMENSSNRSVAITIQAINKRHNDLLKDYLDDVLPLVFFAKHEEANDENKSNIELWKELWNEVSPGDAGIRMNLHVIIPKLEKSLDEASWLRKTQAGNAIHTIAMRLSGTIEESDRLRLINLLLSELQGRTFKGKERLLQALAALCKGLDRHHEVTVRILDAAMRESRKEEPQYRTLALHALGDILEELEVDRFEEVYDMTWYLLEEKELRKDDSEVVGEKSLTADERNKRATIFNKLKETVCETLGKSWPKNGIETQYKYQLLFVERCLLCLRSSTRPVQVSLLGALCKFVERLGVFASDSVPPMLEGNKEKKVKMDNCETRDAIVEKICNQVLSAVIYASALPHTGLKKESLNIVLVLIKRLTDAKDMKNLTLVKTVFEENLANFQKDPTPEVRCRVNDIEEKFSKFSFKDD
ncbi:proteasome-associated protein ECM29 homolog [Rhagoletis pomonella]|uniref:proteasome-associated protein ECM29 homolog n=1 Tax=Rhagoletis pomonella TaxID=28610 RepID=UPI0017829CFB|nr:proteasome-associated protein ECM29 homolog [Rhagoletis pomonella]